MGLIKKVQKRFWIWHWRSKYWWHDTEEGHQAQIGLVCLMALVVLIQMIRMFTVTPPVSTTAEPMKAIYWWVVQLIIAVIALVLAIALRPKQQSAPPPDEETPTVEDGHSIVEAFGDVWITEENILAQRVVGKEGIKAEGGKK